ncbi:MAG TPA: endonuclease III [Candidatus Dojkabacteria bacterium]|nr:endonuclease III [Candidatus Dojkabacteria bacterium]HQG57424.1 endonuclease III [Candidatus Dojkabacteria bacterium]
MSSKSQIKKNAYFALEQVNKIFPEAQTDLKNWSTSFQFLVCIILSAQATDKQVNKVTQKLFEIVPDPKAFIEFTGGSTENTKDVASIINSLNYYNSKARNIVKMAYDVFYRFGGEVPRELTDLVSLAGVGYKTANVFLSHLYKENQGIAVDTHVSRVSKRLGFADEKDTPIIISHKLEDIFSKQDWHKISGRFVLFGRYICKAKKPECKNCPINTMCSYYKNNTNL